MTAPLRFRNAVPTATRRTRAGAAIALTLAFLVPAPIAISSQDPLTRAKGFYASAEYEEALTLLETLKGKTNNSEAAAYQVFCLVALGRRDEARVAIGAIVRTDPLFRPSEADVSPRIRAFFDDVRKPLLPAVVRQSYASAKTVFDKKEWASAASEFDRVMTLLDEIGDADQGAADLRTLATGFRDLARAAVPPAPTPSPAPAMTPTPPAAAGAPAPAIYGPQHADVVRPVVITKKVPEWRPSFAEERMTFAGEIEMLVSEEGKVLSVTLIDGVHPRYDGSLVEAAKDWTFQPATRNGVPVKYRYSLAVNLSK